MPSYAKFDVWQNTAGVNYNAILQVKSTQLTTSFSTTTLISSGGAAVTGLSVDITPRYSTSKILVFGHMVTGYTSTRTQAYYKLKRNGTEVGNGTSGSTGVIARSYIADPYACLTDAYSFLDSPASTSNLTYQIFIGSEAAGFAVYVNRDEIGTGRPGGASSITVMEIAQ